RPSSAAGGTGLMNGCGAKSVMVDDLRAQSVEVGDVDAPALADAQRRQFAAVDQPADRGVRDAQQAGELVDGDVARSRWVESRHRFMVTERRSQSETFAAAVGVQRLHRFANVWSHVTPDCSGCTRESAIRPGASATYDPRIEPLDPFMALMAL